MIPIHLPFLSFDISYLNVYLFFLTIKIICTVLAGGFRVRLAMYKNTDTYSNICFFLGYLFAFIAQMIGALNRNSAAVILGDYDFWIIIIYQILTAGIFVLFLMGTLKTYILNRPNKKL